MSQSHYPLHILTFDRGYRWDAPTLKKPFHWAFFLRTNPNSPDEGIVFQLRGMPGAFHYPGPEKTCNGGSELVEGAKNGELEVGSMPVGEMDRLKSILDAVSIVTVESEKWNCQNWCLTGLESMRGVHWIADGYGDEVVRYWLREDQ